MGDMNTVIAKLEKISDKQAEMNAILAVQAEQLAIHIRRTEALEHLVEMYNDKLYEELKPVQEHVSMLKGAAKVAGALIAIAGIIVGVLKILAEA